MKQIQTVEIIFSLRLYLNNLHKSLINANNKNGALKADDSRIIATNAIAESTEESVRKIM